jgi:hypothetical protein
MEEIWVVASLFDETRPARYLGHSQHVAACDFTREIS